MISTEHGKRFFGNNALRDMLDWGTATLYWGEKQPWNKSACLFIRDVFVGSEIADQSGGN